MSKETLDFVPPPLPPKNYKISSAFSYNFISALTVHAVMTNQQMWGQDLTQAPGFEEAVVEHLKKIRTAGAYEVMKELV